MMTRKDYVLLALHLNRCMEKAKAMQPIASELTGNEAFRRATVEAISAVANALASDNPRFDRDLFLSAAGVTSGG